MRDRRVLTLDAPAVLAQARSMAKKVRAAVEAAAVPQSSIAR
jgi:hypothetical protein